MPYSTPAMVRLALNPATQDGGVAPPAAPSRTAADLPDAQLLDFIAEADAQIDAMIGRFYIVPVAPVFADDVLGDGADVGAVPHPIDYWSRNIACYFATLTVRGAADFTDQDPIARRYSATMTALNMVAAGTAKLQLPDNTTSAAGVGAAAAINPGYVGDLFDASDFNLHPLNPTWPLWPDSPGVGSW